MILQLLKKLIEENEASDSIVIGFDSHFLKGCVAEVAAQDELIFPIENKIRRLYQIPIEVIMEHLG